MEIVIIVAVAIVAVAIVVLRRLFRAPYGPRDGSIYERSKAFGREEEEQNKKR